MKGIILAGGTGSRLFPVTLAVSKQLLPVYDKPMVYYPLSTLMLAGIRDIMVITTPHDRPGFERLLADGSQFGLNICYASQERPSGIAEAFVIGRDFIGDDRVALILGDNIFYGSGLIDKLNAAVARADAATVFAYQVSDPERYGVVELAADGSAISIEEKPQAPKSALAVTGLYFLDASASDVAQNLAPSARGELEITDLLKAYMKRKALFVEVLGRGFNWLDAGTHGALSEASQFVQLLEQRQGLRIACPEEIALSKGFIDLTRFKLEAEKQMASDYGVYLNEIARRIEAAGDDVLRNDGERGRMR